MSRFGHDDRDASTRHRSSEQTGDQLVHSKCPFRLQVWIAVGVAITFLACVLDARASLVNIDFNTSFGGSNSATYVGGAVVGSAGDAWNGINGGDPNSPASISNAPLVDSTGASTGVTLSVTGTSGAFSIGFGCPMANMPLGSLMCDYLYRAGGSEASVILAGLTPGSGFDLILYSMANNEGRVTDFTLDGGTQVATAGADTGFVLGTNYVEFTGTVAANGLLSFTFTGPSEGNLDGIQLTQNLNGTVPEPGTFALVGLALGTVALQRRRR